MGKFESLGFDSPFVFQNLTTTLFMFLLSLAFFTLIFLLSGSSCCFLCVQRIRSHLRGMLSWKFPIGFLMDSYSVVAIACLLNLKYFSEQNAPK